MIVYKIKDSKIVSISRQNANYELQPNEYSSDVWYLKPFFNGSNVVESITQQEIDERAENEAEITAENSVRERITDGETFFMNVATKVKRAYEAGNINATQYKTIRTSLKDVLLPLKIGDWDLAQDAINAITRPNGAMGVLYDFLKNKIDDYVLNNY